MSLGVVSEGRVWACEGRAVEGPVCMGGQDWAQGVSYTPHSRVLVEEGKVGTPSQGGTD